MKERIIGWIKKQDKLTKFLLANAIVWVTLAGVVFYDGIFRYSVYETRSYASESYTVYKTYTGHCYHRSSCGYLRSCIETTKAEALREGLRPCSRCTP